MALSPCTAGDPRSASATVERGKSRCSPSCSPCRRKARLSAPASRGYIILEQDRAEGAVGEGEGVGGIEANLFAGPERGPGHLPHGRLEIGRSQVRARGQHVAGSAGDDAGAGRDLQHPRRVMGATAQDTIVAPGIVNGSASNFSARMSQRA